VLAWFLADDDPKQTGLGDDPSHASIEVPK